MSESSELLDVRRDGFAALGIAAIVAIVYWPGIYGFWGRDDFGVLAFVRLLGSPWPLFFHDHFPVAGWVFRPLGFASMWLCEELFGSDYRANAIFDLVLHAGVSMALFCVLRRAGIARIVAGACTVAFAIHPATIGTALWWNGRFDLLSTLFILIAVHAALAYRDARRWRSLALALVAAFAAMLSKEIGLVAIAAMSVLWLHWAWSDRARTSTALRAVLLAWSCVLVYFSWRRLVLGESAHVLSTLPLQDLIAQGLLSWLQHAPAYLTFWPRLHALSRFALAAGLVLGLGIATIAVARHRLRGSLSRHIDLVACGLCLLALPALLQVPVAVWNAIPLQADVSAIEAAMQSRLYYLGIAGITMMVGGVVGAMWEQADTISRRLAWLAFACVFVAFGVAAHSAAHAFARRSLAISGIAREATAAVGRLDLPASGCQVTFMDMQFPPEWSIYVSADSIVKALAPDMERVKHCWFHSNSPVYFMAAPATPQDAVPYRPYQADGKAAPWRTIGGVVIAYLSAPENPRAGEYGHMIFLRYRDQRFEDVSADVAAGRVAVHLQ